MSARKSTNKAATDSPVSDTSSTRSTTTRSSVQTPGSETDIIDSNIQTDSKRPRRTNVRTPTTPSNSSKKKSDDSAETISIGGDAEDDKIVKSPVDDTKSEDGKKTDSLTDSPARAARKRKVFDKTAIVTRKSAMDLANSTKRVLRDRRNSTGKTEILESEPKKRAAKKSTSSTPEPPTSIKRKRENSIKVDEDIKRIEKIIRLEPTEEVQKVDVEEVDDEKTVKSVELQEEDKLKLLVEETDSKDDELVEVVEIKQEIDEDTEDVPMEENTSKEFDEDQEFVDQEIKQSENLSELKEEIRDDEKLSDSELAIARLFVEEKNSKNLSLSGKNKFKSFEDQKNLEISQSLTPEVDKKIILKREEVKIEEDSKYEAYERPRRARARRLLDTPVTSTKKGGRKSVNSENSDIKAKAGKKIQSNSFSSEAIKPEETMKDDAVSVKVAGLDIGPPKLEKQVFTQDAINSIEKPLIVDTSSVASTAAGKAPPGTSSEQDCEKAASLSPELVSEGVSVMSVKQFYKKPEFLENNLGIEKDPKLGEIVQEVEKSKDTSEKPEMHMPCNSTDLILEKATEMTSLERSPDCSGDSLKDGERLVLDDSTEEDGNNSINKIEDNRTATDSTADLMNLEDSELTKLIVEEEEETLSNKSSTENVDALQTNCDSINRIMAVDSNGQMDVCESDTEIKDKIASNKSSTEDVGISDNQQKLSEAISLEKVETQDDVGCSHAEVEAGKESSEEDLEHVDSEEVFEGLNDIDSNVESNKDMIPGEESENEIKESKVNLGENLMDVDEANENKENVEEIFDVKENCVTTPKKVSTFFVSETHSININKLTATFTYTFSFLVNFGSYLQFFIQQ